VELQLAVRHRSDLRSDRGSGRPWTRSLAHSRSRITGSWMA